MPQNRTLQGAILLPSPRQNSLQHQHFSQLVTSQNWTFIKIIEYKGSNWAVFEQISCIFKHTGYTSPVLYRGVQIPVYPKDLLVITRSDY